MHYINYYKRFGYKEADIWCDYNYKKSQLHPFCCPNAYLFRNKITPKLEKKLDLNKVLGMLKRIKKFVKQALVTRLYNWEFGVQFDY